jgi:membrane protein
MARRRSVILADDTTRDLPEKPLSIPTGKSVIGGRPWWDAALADYLLVFFMETNHFMKSLSPGNIWKVIKLSVRDFSENKITKLSAALAYYTIFSLPGILIIITTLGDVFYGKEAIEGTIQQQISGFVGNDAALQIQDVIRNAAISQKTSLAAIAGIATLLFGATKMFGEIQDSLNQIWNLKAKPKRGWLKLVINRLLSFSMVISLAFLLLVSLVINGLVSILSNHLAAYFPEITITVVYVFNLILTFVITVFLFAIIFKVLPDAMIRWRDVTVGAVATTILFMAGKFAIGYYLGRSNVGSTYGAAGSLIVILLWIYYCAIILYFGAAFTKEYAQHFGYRIYPSDAVWIKKVEVDTPQSLDQLEREKAVDRAMEKVADKRKHRSK